MPRKSSKKTPVVISNILYTDDKFTGTQVGSDRWVSWLEQGHTFYFDGNPAFTARCENRRTGKFWYTFTKHNGNLFKVYVGRAIQIDKARLLEIEATMKRKIENG